MGRSAATLDPQAAEQAAEWFARLGGEDVSDEDLRRWLAWLEQLPAHREAWSRVESLSGRLRGLRDPASREAMNAAGRSRRKILQALGLFAVSAPLAWLASSRLPWREWTADARTKVGETRELRLADGGRLWLDTHSAVSVDYGHDLRRIELHRGALLVRTAPDPQSPARPLVVDARDARLRAIGTYFSVRQDEADSVLAVFEGAVEIQLRDGSATRRIEAGEQVRFDGHRIGAAVTAQPAQLAWSRGMLVADDQRLEDFLRELSRYRADPVRCAAEVADLRLVGAYPFHDFERTLAAVARALPVDVVADADGGYRLVPRR